MRNEAFQDQTVSQEVADEQDMVRRSCQGDQDAFAVLVRTHQRRAYLLAFHLLNDPEEAADAVQEAFLAAWQNLHTFRGKARFSTGLYRIVYHCCLRLLDQRRRTTRDLEAATAQAEQQAIPEAGRDVQEVVADGERQQTIQHAIEDLPETYRAVLLLRSLHELTYEEIAQVLSLPVGTVKTHLFRARTRLKDRLHALEQEEATPPSLAPAPTQPPAGSEAPAASLLARLAPPFLRVRSARERERS